MQPDERRLRDMLACAEELAGHLAGIDEAAFAHDLLRRRAVERLLMIVGEAAKNLSDATRSGIDQPWRQIIRFRDKGIHHYDSLSPVTVFHIATRSVPALAAAIRSHLGPPQ